MTILFIVIVALWMILGIVAGYNDSKFKVNVPFIIFFASSPLLPVLAWLCGLV